MSNNERDTMTERERMTLVIEGLLGQLGVMSGVDLTRPGHASTAQMLASALESLVTARAMLGEEPGQEVQEVQPDQLTAVDAELDRRSVPCLQDEIGRLREEVAGVYRIAATRGDRITELEAELRDARTTPADSDLTTLRRWIVERDARIRELEAQPRFPGLTVRQAAELRALVDGSKLNVGLCRDLFDAIDANTIGGR